MMGVTLKGSPHVAPGAAPRIPAWPGDQVVLHNAGYAVVYSAEALCPLVAFHKLTPELLHAGGHLEREPDFSPDPRITDSRRVADAEYRNRKGLDQGHLVPARDMGTAQAVLDSFLLTNCAAQVGELNRREWLAVEREVRASAMQKGGATYVSTGVVHWGRLRPFRPKLAGRIWVPKAFWKLAYSEDDGHAVGYYAANRADARFVRVGVRELVAATGCDPLDGVAGLRRMPGWMWR